MLTLLIALMSAALATGPATPVQIDCTGVKMATFEAADETGADMLMDFQVGDLLTYEVIIVQTLTCLDQPLTPTAAASVYGLVAMASLVDKDRDEQALRAALFAAHLADARYELPEVLPPSNKLRQLKPDVAAFPVTREQLTAPEGGELLVNGHVTTTRFGGSPAIVQVRLDGAITNTLYLAPAVSWSAQ